jgi:hypothetical protein
LKAFTESPRPDPQFELPEETNPTRVHENGGARSGRLSLHDETRDARFDGHEDGEIKGSNDSAEIPTRGFETKRGEFPAPIAKFLGFTLANAGSGRATIEFEADHRHSNPMGTLHGGVLCDIADATMGIV